MTLPSSFFKKLKEGCANLSMNPEHLLNVMALESGLSSSAHNKNGNASGLLQFMPNTLKGLGYQGSHADFRNLQAEEQLDYCFKLIRSNMGLNGGPFTSASQYYVGNFLPIALTLPGIRKLDPNTVIVAKNPDSPHLPKVSVEKEASFYNANPGLDANKDGFITLGDINTVMARTRSGNIYKDAVKALHESENASAPEEEEENYYWSTPKSTSSKPVTVQPTVSPTVQTTTSNDVDESIENVIEKQLAELSLAASYEVLPKNNILISISHSDLDVSLEFARVLAQALESELISKASIHQSSEHVEVLCQLHAPEQIAFKAVSQFTNAMKETFIEKTSSFISLPLYCICTKGLPTQPLVSTATTLDSYRTFRFKAMK